MPGEESAGELVRQLVAAGWSRRAVADAIGRHNSLVYQVERGAKPGANLRDSLAQLVELGAPPEMPTVPNMPAAPLAPAPRRQAASGRPARVRRPVSVGRAGWSSAQVRTRQAVANGARSLARPIRDAAALGRVLAFEATFRGGDVERIGGDHGQGIDAGEFVADYLDPRGDDVVGALDAWLADNPRYTSGRSIADAIRLKVSSW